METLKGKLQNFVTDVMEQHDLSTPTQEATLLSVIGVLHSAIIDRGIIDVDRALRQTFPEYYIN